MITTWTHSTQFNTSKCCIDRLHFFSVEIIQNLVFTAHVKPDALCTYRTTMWIRIILGVTFVNWISNEWCRHLKHLCSTLRTNGENVGVIPVEMLKILLIKFAYVLYKDSLFSTLRLFIYSGLSQCSTLFLKKNAAFSFFLTELTRSSLTLSNRLCPSLARYHFVSLVLASFFLCVCGSTERQSSDETLV